MLGLSSLCQSHAAAAIQSPQSHTRYSMAGGRGVGELVGVGGSAPPPAGDSAPAAADMLRKMAPAAPAEGKKRKRD